MKVSTSKLSRWVSVGALSGAILMTTTSCEDEESPVGDVLKQCGLACPDQGVAEGNASVTGYIAVDSFFKSVVNFKSVATGVSADIQAELDGIQGAFGISNKDLAAANGKLGAAIKAKLDATYKGKLTVKAQPAKCEVDASFSAKVAAECQAQADCDVDPGKAAVSCEGTCTVEANAEAKCDANAEVVCNVSGPELSCSGSCEGSCTTDLAVAASCEGSCTGSCSGTCEGTCEGTCMGDTDSGAGCKGTCMGTCRGSCSAGCQGKCEVSGMAAVNCKGKCEGSCSYKPANASCEANAKVECELKAEAKAECKGRCEGEFDPPKVDCDASASCEASAKAEAKFQAKCTPPSLEVTFTSTASIDAAARAQLDFAISELRVRLPRLLAALKKADLVVKAGGELTGEGADAVKATFSGLAKGKIEAVAAFRIANCAPDELKASASVITNAGKDLSAKVTAATEVTASVGM